MTSLVLMACSGMKLAAAAPAFDLYRGVMYSSFRAHVKPLYSPAVIILSASYGFISPTKIISPYDLMMTGVRADEMIADLPNFMRDLSWPDDIADVFLAGGKHYRRVMRAALSVVAPNAIVLECSGGIGVQRSQLGRYLDNLK